jgi:transcriptional regulator with XRE-family HTH domain
MVDTIQKQMKTLRKDHNLSQLNVSDILGMTRRNYSLFETGLLYPKKSMAKILWFSGLKSKQIRALGDSVKKPDKRFKRRDVET